MESFQPDLSRPKVFCEVFMKVLALKSEVFMKVLALKEGVGIHYLEKISVANTKK